MELETSSILLGCAIGSVGAIIGMSTVAIMAKRKEAAQQRDDDLRRAEEGLAQALAMAAAGQKPQPPAVPSTRPAPRPPHSPMPAFPSKLHIRHQHILQRPERPARSSRRRPPYPHPQSPPPSVPLPPPPTNSIVPTLPRPPPSKTPTQSQTFFERPSFSPSWFSRSSPSIGHCKSNKAVYGIDVEFSRPDLIIPGPLGPVYEPQQNTTPASDADISDDDIDDIDDDYESTILSSGRRTTRSSLPPPQPPPSPPMGTYFPPPPHPLPLDHLINNKHYPVRMRASA